MATKLRVVVLGAGFGGLELTTILSEKIGDSLDLTLIDQSDSFFFGFSKFDVMFGHKTAEQVRVYYKNIVKPGVKFVRDTITPIDPISKQVGTQSGTTYKADILVVALGADYDVSATPGLAEAGNEFYSFAGAERLREVLPTFSKGNVIVGVCSAPFKCPPAPSEAALLMHDYLVKRGIRKDCTISIVMPFGLPIPPSPDTSLALLDAFAEREITFIPKHVVKSINPSRKAAILDDGTEMPFDLFLGIPKHRVPKSSGGKRHDGQWLDSGFEDQSENAVSRCICNWGRQQRRNTQSGRICGRCCKSSRRIDYRGFPARRRTGTL